MKLSNLKKFAAAAAATAITASAHAAGELTASLAETTAQAKSDIGTGGGLIIGVVVACAAVAWLRRIIK